MLTCLDGEEVPLVLPLVYGMTWRSQELADRFPRKKTTSVFVVDCGSQRSLLVSMDAVCSHGSQVMLLDELGNAVRQVNALDKSVA